MSGRVIWSNGETELIERRLGRLTVTGDGEGVGVTADALRGMAAALDAGGAMEDGAPAIRFPLQVVKGDAAGGCDGYTIAHLRAERDALRAACEAIIATAPAEDPGLDCSDHTPEDAMYLGSEHENYRIANLLRGALSPREGK